MAGDRVFVQFPHPGGEHVPAGDEMAWNLGAHRRKFLLARGRYLGADGQPYRGQVTMWGEWEPPSRVVRRWPADGRLPRVLHRPYWSDPGRTGPRQNTDPWVWGPTMVYSNCKQITGPQRRRTAMQGLARGSVICFGSTIDGEFCLDTLMVIAGAQPWVPAEADQLDVDEAFKICTGGSVASTRDDAHLNLTLYRGAAASRPVDGMFSFVPARPAHQNGARFARPAIRLPGLINASNRQSTWGSRRPLPAATVREAWDSVRDQVLASGAVLAVELDTPVREDAADVPLGPPRKRC